MSSMPETPVHVSPRGETLVMRGDRRRLARVVANLIDNARLHGGGTASVCVSEAEGDGEPLGHVWIAVEDDWFGPVTWQDADAPAVTVTGEALLAACAERGIATPNPDGDFVRAVRDGTPAHPDVTVALRAHRLVDAAYRSAAAGGAPVAV